MITAVEALEICAGLLVLYIVASPRVAERAYHVALFEPHKYPKGNYDNASVNGRDEDIFFPSLNGKQLHAWHFKGNPDKKTVLVCHGNTGNIADLDGLIILLLRTGASVFVFDYQGFGRSGGAPSVSGICRDGHAAYKYLVEQRGIAPADIVLYGESLGGAVACQLAHSVPVAGLILQSAFSCLTRISFESYAILGIFPEILFPPPYFNNVAMLKKLMNVPVLITHGQKDADIKFTHAQALFNGANNPKSFLPLPNTAHHEIAQEDWGLFTSSVGLFLSELETVKSSSTEQAQRLAPSNVSAN